MGWSGGGGRGLGGGGKRQKQEDGEGVVCFFVEGPGEGEEEELCVRKRARIDAVKLSIRAAKGLAKDTDLELWYDQGRFEDDDVVGELGLSDGDILQARWGARQLGQGKW